MKKEKFRDLGVCKRCKNEMPINSYGLCRNCADEVDREYALLYTQKTME